MGEYRGRETEPYRVDSLTRLDSHGKGRFDWDGIEQGVMAKSGWDATERLCDT